MRLSAATIVPALVLLGLAILAGAPTPTPAPLRTGEVVAHLARTISWYRHVTAVEQSSLPSADILQRDSTQRTATRALQLGFEFARAAAPLVKPEQSSGGTALSGGSSVERTAARAAERIANAEKRIAEVDAGLAKAGGQARATLMARRQELLAELNFAKQINDSVQGLRTFLRGQATGGADLLGFVDRLERSVPEVLRGQQAPPAGANASGVTDASFRLESSGIIGLATEAVRMARVKADLDGVLAETDTLRKNLDQLRAPLVSDLTTAIRRGDAAANDSAAQDVQQMNADRQEIEGLSERFKLVSAVMTPLREHGLQIEIARGSLLEQRATVQQRYSNAGGYLLFRVLGLIVMICVVLGISELWRRGTFRYVHDARRQKQFLLLRRIVVSCVLAAAVVIGLVNELGSLATYAGFLTAGLAVALQNVIASVVAYFFLIGRYGLRVGDRVTISGVSGDVVEIGLVRLHLMELAGEDSDLHPTGRVVGFSNSVLFQPAALFRQVPGTDYVWHTVALTLARDTDLQLAESRLMTAVEGVHETYRERVEQQHAAFQRVVDLPVPPPKPVGRLRFTSEGLEFVVRYPAEMRNASDTDDRVIRALSDAIGREPRLALAGSTAPKLQSAV
jgi:small-conductance mechanosensitive channel